MSLSKINESPNYFTTLPSTGEKIKFRPFLVKEERALLTAAESEDVDTMYATLESIVRSCVVNPPKKLTTFDLEMLFVQIRSKSVGEQSDITITCDSCAADSLETIDIRKVTVITPDTHKKKIQLSDSIIATMKYPSIDEIVDIKDARSKEEAKLMMVKACIDTIFHNEDIYVVSEETDEELSGFIDTLNSKQYSMLKDFVDTIPYAYLEHSWICKSCGKEHKTGLKGIFSFF